MTSTEFDAATEGATLPAPLPTIDAWQAPPTRAVRLHASFLAGITETGPYRSSARATTFAGPTATTTRSASGK